MTIRYSIVAAALLIALTLAVVLGARYRPALPVVANGAAEQVALRVTVPNAIGEKGFEPGQLTLHMPTHKILSYSSVIEFVSQKVRLDPVLPIHVFYLVFNKDVVTNIELNDESEIIIRSSRHYIFSAWDDASGTYDLEFEFHSGTENPLWSLPLHDPQAVGTGWIIGFGETQDLELLGGVRGYYFEKDQWPVPTLNFALFDGFEGKVSVPATEAFINVRPRLAVGLREAGSTVFYPNEVSF